MILMSMMMNAGWIHLETDYDVKSNFKTFRKNSMDKLFSHISRLITLGINMISWAILTS